MVRAAVIGLALAIAAPAAAQSPDQFDLICVGERGTHLSKQPATVRYRLDLQARRWCADGCPNALPIHDVTPDLITLIKEGVAGSIGPYHTHIIGRTDGRALMLAYPRGRGTLSSFAGDCTKAEFSGFPAPRF